MGATEQFAVHIAGGHCFIPETKIGTHLAQIHGSGHLSHYDARGAAVIFHSSASTAATFDRGSLASQSRLLTFSLSLLLSVFFLLPLSVYKSYALNISFFVFLCVCILSCHQHYALVHIHTNTYIDALLRTNTTTDKGVIFCAIFFFFTLRALLSSETNFPKPSNNQN